MGRGYWLNALLVNGRHVRMMIQADTPVDPVHDRLELPRRLFVPAQHEDGRAGTRDAAAERACGLAGTFDVVESRDQHAADRFDDDIFERTADQVVVVLDQARYQS